MAIISSVDYSTALSYKGMNLSTKYDNKKHKVYFKLVADDYSLQDAINLARVSKNILMINYIGLPSNAYYLSLTSNTGVYIGRVIDFGNNITEEDILGAIKDVPEGVVPIINLPEDFNNINFVWKMCQKYPRIRFCGGNLFAIDGVKIGMVGIDTLDKQGIKYDFDSYAFNNKLDAFDEVDINTLDITASSKPERVVKEKKSSSSTSDSSPKKKSNQSEKFKGLFGNFQIGGF
jgi:hypothetical protein